jgi:hypothetical protein
MSLWRLQKIYSLLKEINCTKDRVIYQEGDEKIDGVYFIVSGIV